MSASGPARDGPNGQAELFGTVADLAGPDEVETRDAIAVLRETSARCEQLLSSGDPRSRPPQVTADANTAKEGKR